jgi:hypothetical protein
VLQGYGRDVFATGLLALEDAGLDQPLLLPMHDEYVLRLPDDWADEYAADVADCVRSRLGNVEERPDRAGLTAPAGTRPEPTRRSRSCEEP